jgi:hypothetical protein
LHVAVLTGLAALVRLLHAVARVLLVAGALAAKIAAHLLWPHVLALIWVALLGSASAEWLLVEILIVLMRHTM